MTVRINHAPPSYRVREWKTGENHYFPDGTNITSDLGDALSALVEREQADPQGFWYIDAFGEMWTAPKV